jgi:transposase
MSQSNPSPDDPRNPPPALSTQPVPDLSVPPRLRRPDRQQLLVQPRTLDQLVPEDHPVRAIWALVQRWDLTLFLQGIRARGERPGRAATDPQLLIALWLYATIEGIGRGRQLAVLCIESNPYKWLCGGISLNYHTLNDFRVDHEEALDDLLTQMIAVLTQAQIVSLERIALDGTRIRGSAGANSFGERETLEKHLEAARAHLEEVKRLAADPTLSAQQKAARERCARQRQARLEQALVELKKVEEAKAQQKDKPTKSHPARASSTDPEARMMRMPDGGTRPAYNLELATDCDSRAIVGVEMTNAGSDAGQDAPMRDQVEERADEAVEEQLMDGGFVSLEAIDRAAAEEVTVYAPVPKPRKEGVDRYVPKPGDSEAVGQWRQRMGTAAAKPVYKQRSSTIETINGELKTERGLGRLLVRGLRKVQCAALWSALAYNVVHFGPILLSQ